MRPKTTYLRESHREVRPDATVIDADFVIVRGRRNWFARLTLALAAVGIAAAAGMLVPPIVVAARAFSDTL